MKKGVVAAIAVVLFFGLVTIGYTKYVSGFKIVEVQEKQVTIQKADDEPIMLTVRKAGKYKVGDKVKYDAKKQKIRSAVTEQYQGC